ncbi:MAG: PilT/PilU family type 4a pilus ATPase [Phycisphaerales bacterium]|nr:PilT/PilU family type 4a pilus ATPase [Phycisphaerales bacterium]
MATLKDILAVATRRGASDVVLVSESAPFMRVEGEWLPVPSIDRSAFDSETTVLSLIPEDRLAVMRDEREMNFSRELPPFGRLRFNLHYQRGSPAATIRLIWPTVRSIDELELPRALPEAALRHQGLILVCGRAGSGKSTTLAAIVQYILSKRRAHVITIEDPIEYVHGNGQGVCEQRELHSDTLSWDAALKNVLRQSPDVIVIGELQDRASIATAVSAAETGHLVLASLHAQNAVQCVTRIVDSFPGDQQPQIRVQLANSLVAVLAQELVPSTREGGRVLATEFMLVNPAIRNLIRSNEYAQIHNAILTGRGVGMHTLQDSLEQHLARKTISEQEMLCRLTDSRLACAVGA